MGKRIVFNIIEDDTWQVLYASPDANRLAIEKTLTLKNDEIDDFLKNTKIGNFRIICHFKRFFSDIVSIPPVKKVYLEKVLEAEIRKKFPEITEFSYFYHEVTEKASEKAPLDIFFFAVENSDLNAIVDRFNKYGITVDFIFPDIISLSSFVLSMEEYKNKTVLCLYVKETDKTFFLLRKGQLSFIRLTPSLSKEIQEIDIDNINMTISYCRQIFRINPDMVLLINSAQSVRAMVTVSSLKYPEYIVGNKDVIRDFIASISGMLMSKQIKTQNLLPRKHFVLNLQKRVATYAAIVFLVMSAISVVYVTSNINEIFSLSEKINLARRDLARTTEAFSNNDNNLLVLQQFLPLITLINEARSKPDEQKIFLDLQFLPVEGVNINSISIKNEADSQKIKIDGNLSGANYSIKHRTFVELISRIGKISGMEIISSSMDLKEGKVQIEIKNKGVQSPNG